MCPIFFIHSSVDGHLGCFHVLAIVNRAGQILRKAQPSRLKQEEIENVNRPITSAEIETVIKVFQQTKAQDQMASQVNSIKHLEKS